MTWAAVVMAAIMGVVSLVFVVLLFVAFRLWLRRDADIDRTAVAQVPDLAARFAKLEREFAEFRMTKGRR